MGNGEGFITINTEIVSRSTTPPEIKQRAVVALDISLPKSSPLANQCITLSKQKIEKILKLGGHADEA